MPNVSLAAGVVVLSTISFAQEPAFRSSANAVVVFCTVTDGNGRLVAGLSRNDFLIDDDGKRQGITTFDVNPVPLTAIVMLDRSLSTQTDTRMVQLAVDQFAARLLPADKARVGAFSLFTQIEPATFTHSRGELMTALRSLSEQAGPTPLWKAVDTAIEALKKEDGRRVLLLFSDGYEAVPASQGNVGFQTAVEHARAADVMVYSVGLHVGIPGQTGRRQAPSASLQDLSAQTGGGYIEIGSATDLAETFSRVIDELHNQYLLGFVPAKLDGKRHTLQVRMRDGKLTVRARRSYVADVGKTDGAIHQNAR